MKNIPKNGTNTSSVNKELPICERTTMSVDVYGDPGCADNPNREDLCALFRACKEYDINYTLAFGSLLGVKNISTEAEYSYFSADFRLNMVEGRACALSNFSVLGLFRSEKISTKILELSRCFQEPLSVYRKFAITPWCELFSNMVSGWC